MKALRNNHFILAMLLVGFVACRTGKDYQRPELGMPKQFSEVSFADTSSIADIEWKNFFTDTTLQGLITRGLAYNNDLLAAIKRIDMARSRVRQAKNLQLPEVNLQLQGSINRPSDNSLNGLSTSTFLGQSFVENYQALVNISWEADIWGRIRRQKETALADYVGTQEAGKAIQTQLVSDIAQGFYNLLMLDKQLEIAKNNLKINDTFVNVTRLLRDGGEVTTLAVQQAESQRQATALLVPQLEESIALQENALQLLTGQYPGKVARQVSLTNIELRENLSTGVPVAVVSRRPDVRSREMALVAANAQVGVAQANMYPGLNITAGGGLEAYEFKNWYKIPGSLFGLATGTIAQPIFQRRRLKTELEVAKLQRDEAELQFKQSVLQASTEVANALVQTEKLKEQQVIAIGQADTLHRAVNNAFLLFKSDMANYLEVLTAQTNALQADLNVASLQRNRLGAVVDLYRSLGGGWK